MRAFTRLLIILCFAFSALAQSGGDPNKSWTATTDSTDSTTGAQTRRTESHKEAGNRTLDTQSTQIYRSGRYEPFQDVETETVKLNATTTRTVVRTFGRDSNGQKTLLQVSEEEKQELKDGEAKTVRTISNPDLEGRLQLIQREVADTRKIDADTSETKSIVFLPGVNGMAASMQTQERQHRNADTIDFQKTTLLPDGAGNWQAGEVKRGTIKDDGKSRSSEERVSRQNADGQLSEVSRTLAKESKAPSGESRSTVETFSTDVPGSAPDGHMHLVQRVTGTRSGNPNGAQTTRQQLEQIKPGDPSAGLQITVTSTNVQASGASGTQATQTLQARDPGGNMNVVTVDMTKSTKTPPVEVQPAPAQQKPAQQKAAAPPQQKPK
jgi:hypothetical protein